MKRAGKKPKSNQVRMTAKEIDRLKKDVTKSAVDKSVLLILAAATDELHLTDDQLAAIMIRTNRYAGYIDDHLVKLKDIQASIEKSTGIKLKGWL